MFMNKNAIRACCVAYLWIVYNIDLKIEICKEDEGGKSACTYLHEGSQRYLKLRTKYAIWNKEVNVQTNSTFLFRIQSAYFCDCGIGIGKTEQEAFLL